VGIAGPGDEPEPGDGPEPRAQSVEAGLRARGFDEATLALAREDVDRHAGGASRHLAAAAAFRLLGIPASELEQYASWDLSLTEYYNWRKGGKGLVIGGWICIAGGLNLMLLGSALPESEGPLVVGVLLAAVGVPLLLAGKAKTRDWAEGEVLEQGSTGEMERFRLGALPQKGRTRHAGLGALPPGRASLTGLGLRFGF
jgi:hypothetical protein